MDDNIVANGDMDEDDDDGAAQVWTRSVDEVGKCFEMLKRCRGCIID